MDYEKYTDIDTTKDVQTVDTKLTSGGKHMADPKKAGKDSEPEEESVGSFLKSLLIDLVIAMLLAALVLYFVRPTIVKQSSMEDTLHENDYMIMARQAYKSHGPERGDIVIFQSELADANGNDKLLIKRVIGLPGDELTIINQQVYINGELYMEDYLKDGFTPAGDLFAEGEIYTVPEGCYFCMGDNRVHSVDSRSSTVGPVQFEAIQGKVILRLFPFNKIQKF